ncbi:MAG: hypothetical protein BalsKO_25510 [Balneolaceae bacterium]
MNNKNNDKGLSNLESELEQFLKREEAELERTHKSYLIDKPPDKIKSFFKDKPLGRFLSGRSKRGRVTRKIGLASLGLGGINVMGIGPELTQLTSDAESLVNQFNELLLLLGAILTSISHIIDRMEQYNRVADERELEEGEIPAIKKVLRAIAQQKDKQIQERKS